MKNVILCVIVFVVFSFSCQSIYAHQQNEAYITLLFNEQSGNLEVSHRFLIHDAEHVLDFLFNENNDLSTDLKTQERFAGYIQNNFSLAGNNEKVFTLNTVGSEVDGKFFWVYQEMLIPKVSSLKIKHSALQEVLPEQINHINIEKLNVVRSVRLDKSDKDHWKIINLDK